MRVLISNSCSFWFSRAAVLRARELGASWASPDHILIKGEKGCWLDNDNYQREEQYSLGHCVPRHDPTLLQIFDELGPKMDGEEGREVRCINIPDDVAYFVGSYLAEWIAEAHRTWNEDGENSGGGPVFTKESKFSDFSS